MVIKLTEVCSVRFKSRGKAYFFDPAGTAVSPGDSVIVETANGLEFGECTKGNHEVEDNKIVPPLRPVIRIATEADLRSAERNKSREAEAFSICQKKIEEHGLDMKLVDVEFNFEGNKILFFFTSDGRVDFRELVKDLAAMFRTRIELRQIGVRDEAKMIGGLGICGRAFCCKQFLDDFQPVSTKMAKTQSMSLNQAKISGSCGRLMCCLRYEQAAYENLIKTSPKNGAFVETPAGYGNISHVNLLRQKVKVSLDGEPTQKVYKISDIAVVPGGRPEPGAPLPVVLNPEIRLAVLREEALQASRLTSSWEFKSMVSNEDEEPASAPRQEQWDDKNKSDRRPRRRGGSSRPSNGSQPKENAENRRSDAQNPLPQRSNSQSQKRPNPNRNRQAQNPQVQGKPNQPQPHSKPQITPPTEVKQEKKRGYRPRRRTKKSPDATNSQQ